MSVMDAGIIVGVLVVWITLVAKGICEFGWLTFLAMNGLIFSAFAIAVAVGHKVLLVMR